jgi:hypothetical protein
MLKIQREFGTCINYFSAINLLNCRCGLFIVCFSSAFGRHESNGCVHTS